MERKARKAYTREFKLEAVRLAAVDGRPKAQIARQLGIRVNQPRKWRQEFEAENARANSKLPPVVTDEVEQLRREIARLRTENDCWDNAPMESFFHTLKTELVMHCTYRTRDQARASVFDYVEVFYNRQRRHSTINYEAPLVFEAMKAS